MNERLSGYLVDEMPGSKGETILAAGFHDIREALKALGAVAQQPTSLSSVELSQTAKGATTVKVYGSDPRAAADEAQRLYDELVGRYAPKEAQP